MKRIGIIMLCMLLLCGCFSVAADNPARVTTTASAATLKRGDTVTLTVSVENSPSVASMAITMGDTWDDTVFEYVSAQWLLSGAMLKDVDETRMNAAIMFSTARTFNGDVFEIKLKVKETSGIGYTTLIAGAVLGSAAENNPVALISCEVQIVCDHSWKEADCAYPKTCPFCGATEGEALGHDYQNNTCSRCGMTREEASTAATTLPTQVISTTVGSEGTTEKATSGTTAEFTAGTTTEPTTAVSAGNSGSTTSGQTTSPSLSPPTRTTIGCAPSPLPTFVFPTVGTSAGQFTPTSTTTMNTSASAEGTVSTSGQEMGSTADSTALSPSVSTTVEPSQSTGVTGDNITVGSATVVDGSTTTAPAQTIDTTYSSVPVQDTVTVPAPKENSHTWVFVLLSIVVVLGVSGAVFGVLYRKKK